MSKRRSGTLLGILFATGLLAACIPLFTDGLFQTLRLSFRIDDSVVVGEKRLVHATTFPEDVKVKKTFVQLSGRLEPAEDAMRPTQLTIVAEIENLDTGKLVQRVTLRLDIDENGDFRSNTRVRKNIGAGELMSVTLEPGGADLVADSELTICIDLVKKKGELSLLPDCLEAETQDPDPADPEATFTSLANDFFAPTCSRSGCHNSGSAQAGLVLEPAQAFANLVNVPSSQRPELNRVTPGDADNSYLVKKLRGADIQGDRMPRGGPFLPPEQIDRFVRWIQNGAPND